MSKWYFEGFISKLCIAKDEIDKCGKSFVRDVELEITPSDEYRYKERSGKDTIEYILLVGERSDVRSAKLIVSTTPFFLDSDSLRTFLNGNALVLMKVQHAKARFYVESDRISSDGIALSGCDIL